MKNKKKNGLRPVWMLALVDLLIAGAALLVFAFFHHVMPQEEQAVGITSQRMAQPVETLLPTPEASPVATATPAPTATLAPELTPEPTAEPTPSPTPSPTPDPVGYFGTKFADKFTSGEVIQVENNYQSANVNVNVEVQRYMGANCFVADIYVKDISCLRSGFAEDTYGRGYYEWPKDLAERFNSVVLMNGDYYGGHKDGVVIRNGTLYRDDEKLKRDVGVIYWDGTMKCFSPNEFNAEAEMAKGAYQAWNFGPMLLDENGQPMTEFNTKVSPRNPRAVIGYYEPGHYCFVVVDGRSNKSVGLSMKNLSQFMFELGCKGAYNLDGGETAQLMCGTKMVNDPYKNGRQCSDVLIVVDEIVGKE